MTKNDIIRMAREAGGADISSHGWTSWVGTQSTEFLERFAKRVADAAAAVEREACAKVCEQLAMQQDRDVRDQCAEAIREMGNT